mmetsp:Transcript_13941/g.29250  ORF Transcript_13941/g.29250 Transcript_13941/m.29250 type:complete len:211 (+) Transcript_13941:575-1207(+)
MGALVLLRQAAAVESASPSPSRLFSSTPVPTPKAFAFFGCLSCCHRLQQPRHRRCPRGVLPERRNHRPRTRRPRFLSRRLFRPPPPNRHGNEHGDEHGDRRLCNRFRPARRSPAAAARGRDKRSQRRPNRRPGPSERRRHRRPPPGARRPPHPGRWPRRRRPRRTSSSGRRPPGRWEPPGRLPGSQRRGGRGSSPAPLSTRRSSSRRRSG